MNPVDECSVCREQLGHIRAEDGPAWATILVAGHILAPFLLAFLPNSSWPDWLLMATTVAATLTLTLAPLPRMKVPSLERSGDLAALDRKNRQKLFLPTFLASQGGCYRVFQVLFFPLTSSRHLSVCSTTGFQTIFQCRAPRCQRSSTGSSCCR